MTTQQTLRAAALAGVCLLPLISVAQAQDFDVSSGPAKPVTNALSSPDNEVTVGGAAVTKKSPVFGRYNGMTD